VGSISINGLRAVGLVLGGLTELISGLFGAGRERV